MGGAINRYTKEEWVDLMTNLKGLPNFRHRVRSSPLDEEKNVYVIYVYSGLSTESYPIINEICIIVTADRVHVEVVLKEKEESDKKLREKIKAEFHAC